MYLVLLGHGICYIPGIIYINIRSSQTVLRIFKISCAHIIYLTGVAVGSMMTVIQYINIIDNNIRLLLILSTSIILFGFIANELLHQFIESYNYKKSLDPNVNRANTRREIFVRKIFQITNVKTNVVQDYEVNIPPNLRDEIYACILAICTKALNIVYFYYPFLYLNEFINSGITNLEMGYSLVHWTGVAGVILSGLVLIKFSLKTAFILSCIIKMVALIIITVSINSLLPATDVLGIIYFIAFSFYAFGYAYADIICFETVRLPFNEITLAIGYTVEIFTIGFMHYTVSKDLQYLCPSPQCPNISIILKHSLPFMIISLFLMIRIYFSIPELTSKMSLLEVKNATLRYKNEGMEPLQTGRSYEYNVSYISNNNTTYTSNNTVTGISSDAINRTHPEDVIQSSLPSYSQAISHTQSYIDDTENVAPSGSDRGANFIEESLEKQTKLELSMVRRY